MSCDLVVVGAGLSGAVVAERMASSGARVLVVEQRSHLGGNCHDRRDDEGVWIHTYGPHIFHTDRPEVWEYLSRFTEWIPYRHRVLASVDGVEVPLPFNLNTLRCLFAGDEARELEELLRERFGYGSRVTVAALRQCGDVRLERLAEFIHAKFFANYSRKQWGIDPARLDPAVTARVPVFVSDDDGYFQDPWQGIPAEGYSGMVERMLSHPRIEVRLGVPMSDVVHLDVDRGGMALCGVPFSGQLVYTGMVDALFGYRFGRLPYRSLRFELERVPDGKRQAVAVVNHPNEHDYTRVTDFAHFTLRPRGPSTLMHEYPGPYSDDGVSMPFYPVFSVDNQALFERYKAAAQALPRLHLLGRLAQYKYYDMDDAVAAAIGLCESTLLPAGLPCGN